MALPFVLGVAVGAATVIAFSNKKELKDVAQKGIEKGKELGEEITKTAKSTAKCIKEKVSKDRSQKKESTQTDLVKKREKEKNDEN